MKADDFQLSSSVLSTCDTPDSVVDTGMQRGGWTVRTSVGPREAQSDSQEGRSEFILGGLISPMALKSKRKICPEQKDLL